MIKTWFELIYEKQFMKKLAFENMIDVSNSARDLAAKKPWKTRLVTYFP